MKKNNYFRNIALMGVLGIALVVCVVVKAYNPMGVLPKLDLPNMVLLSLLALLLDHYLISSVKRCDGLVALFAALTFAALPWAAGFSDGWQILKLAVAGGVVFFLTAWLFGSMEDRLSSGPAAKLTPVFSALGLYLAAQCFAGILL